MAAPSIPASHRVIRYALRLLEELQKGATRDLDREQGVLTNLVLEVPAAEEGSPDRGARYAVVCWLDELFTCHSPWASHWNEQKLESALYGSNDRAWEFWRQAELAASKPTDDILSVYFLCVALGFRGEMRNHPERLDAWVEKTRTRVARVSAPAENVRRTLARRGVARPMHGANRVRRLVAVACVVSLAMLPVATFAVMHRLLG